ncbi:retrovirus-related pol polyprotein from transposon TNT 1-94 [Tanacetum coccineum]
MEEVEVPQTLNYRGGQLNVAPILEVENFTNWKKRFMCHIIDDQMNSIINCLTAKSTWDGLILYHEGPFDVKESRVMDLKLWYNAFKFKECESLTQTLTRYKALMNELVNVGIKLSKLEINTGFINGLPKKWLAFCQSLRNTNHVKESELPSLFDFQDSPDDEEDTRSSQEYMNDLEEEYQVRALLAKSKRFFKKGTQRFSSAKATDQTECYKCGKKVHFARDCWSKKSLPSYQSPFQPKHLHSSKHKPELRHTKDLEAKYNKVKAKLALLSSSASAPSSSSGKNKCLIAESYDWDEEEVSSDDNDVTEVKALMALADEERIYVGKESVRNGEWIKISMKKVHTLLEMEDNDDRKSFLDYLCIDLNYLLVLKQAKLDLLTMQHVNTEILKKNQNLRNELKELTSITEAWLNSSNKVNQCISEQIPTQKKKILGIDQLTEDTSSSGLKDPVFVKSSANNLEVFITSSNKPKLSDAEYFTLSNDDTGKVPSNESQRNITDHSIVVSDSTTIDYDSVDESSVCITINERSSAPARGNKSSLVSKTNSAPAGTDPHVLADQTKSHNQVIKYLDSLEDDPVIVVDDSDEDEEDESQKHKLELKKNKVEAEVALFKAQPFFPNIRQLNELLDIPSKFNELTEEVKVLKQQVHELEIELPGDLKEIPSKLEDFTKTVALVQAKLKTLDALPAEDQSVPSAGQADTMPAEGEKNTNQATISQFFQRRAENNAEKENLNNQQPKPTTPPATTIIPLIITTTTAQMQSPPQNSQKGSSQLEREHIKKDKGKKAMSSKDAEEMSTESDSDDETTHVPGSMVESSKKKDFKKFDFVTEDEEHVHLTEEQTVVNKYYNDKLQYDRYCDKMLNRKAKLRITNCDILTRKGPITLKVYREDDTSKIILEFKASDLHLGEWREVVKACPNKKAELGIDLDRPLSEQDPLDRLNDLPNKKRKHADDIHHFFRANKRIKSSVQYEDHPAGTVLNEPVLRMILFNSYHRQDFVTIEDFRDFSNTMLYIVQEIFFRHHQGPGFDDHARTFSSLLLAEIDKRNLNPLKHMRVIEQLRQ